MPHIPPLPHKFRCCAPVLEILELLSLLLNRPPPAMYEVLQSIYQTEREKWRATPPAVNTGFRSSPHAVVFDCRHKTPLTFCRPFLLNNASFPHKLTAAHCSLIFQWWKSNRTITRRTKICQKPEPNRTINRNNLNCRVKLCGPGFFSVLGFSSHNN